MRQAVTRSVFSWNQVRTLEDLISKIGELSLAATDLNKFFVSLEKCLDHINFSKQFAVLQKKGNASCEVLFDSMGLQESAAFSTVENLVLNSESCARPASVNPEGWKIFCYQDSFLVVPSLGLAAVHNLSTRAVERFFGSCLCVMQGIH